MKKSDLNFESQYIPRSSLVFAHPLLKHTFTALESTELDDTKKEIEIEKPIESENDVDFLDPLGAASSHKFDVDITKLDKPSLVAKETAKESRLDNTLAETNDQFTPNLDPILAGFRPWSEFRSDIFENFKTTDKLALETSFLEPFVQKPLRTRLPKEKSSNIQEYEKKLFDLRKLFLYLWNHGQRIECIKLMTEIARILQSTSISHFYPTQFAFVTDFLDLFGNFVYERLLKKAKQERLDAGIAPLPTNFAIHDILEQTRITTRNWFGKVQAITEVVSRIYIETALLSCMKFMDESAISDNLMRMCALAQKIQHPLISAYARCYICRIGMRLNPADRVLPWKCLNDWMQTYTQQPISLVWPALEYVIQCVSFNAVTYDDLLPLWEYCKSAEKRPIILKAMLKGVSPFYLGEHAMEACKLITSSDIVTADELCAFGKNVNKVEVAEDVRKPILRAVWKCIGRLTSLKSYITCCDVWIEFAAKYFTVNELHIILEAIIQKMTPEKKFEAHYDHLIVILEKIVETTTVFAQILNMEIFPQFLDIFQGESVRQKSATLILTAFVRRYRIGSFEDFGLAQQIIGVCKRLHDSTDMYASNSEVDEISFLIQSSLDRFNLNSNPDEALSFFVSCRAALMNIDQCQKYVIQKIISLTLYVIRNAKHSSSRAIFLQACLANLFITIPSLVDPILKLQLSIQSAQVALAAQSFLQLNAIFEYCLELFNELPSNTHQEFSNTGTYFLSFLIMAPEFNEENFLYVFTHFLETIKNFDWPSTSDLSKGRLLLSCLQFLFVRSRLNQTALNSFQLLQFQWMRKEIRPENVEVIGERIDKVSDLLRPLIRQEPADNPQLSMACLEMIALLVDGVSHTLRSMAKDAYKKCKNAPKMAQRLKNLKFED